MTPGGTGQRIAPIPPMPPSPGDASVEGEEAPSDAGGSLNRVVAVLIMVVTLTGTGVAYLQTQASHRAGSADRRAQAHSIQTFSSLVSGGRAIGRWNASFDASNDADWLRAYLTTSAQTGGPGAAYAAALAQAYDQVATSVGQRALDLGYNVAVEAYQPFYVEQYTGTYEAIEFQKAFARERDAWGDKSAQFVTVLTILAVALFLLGLTLTTPAVARTPLLVMGVGVATLAAVWVLAIWQRPVEQPSTAAVESYARGQARLDVIPYETAAERSDYEAIIADATRAIQARPDFREAYLVRGGARFEYDLAERPDGPQGSVEALNDFDRAIELDPGDFGTWVNRGAAQFWLGRYEAALESTQHALSLKDDEPIGNLNAALFLLTTGDEPGYDAQMRRSRDVLISIPSWLRNIVVFRYDVVFDRGLAYRTELAGVLERMREDLLRMVHEIEVSDQMTGEPNPPPVDATMTPTRVSQGEPGIDFDFRYAGMSAGQPWLHRVYVDGVLQGSLSTGTQPFDDSIFRVPDGELRITVPIDGLEIGQIVRVEVFVEGALLASNETAVV